MVKRQIMEREFVSQEEANFYTYYASFIVFGAGATSATTFVESLLTEGSLNVLWSFINSEQHIIFLPLCPSLKYPANVAIFNVYLRMIVFFSILPTDVINEKVYDMPESEPYNVNYAMFNYDSELFVENMGSRLWIIFFYLAALLFYVTVHRIMVLKKRLDQYVVWNGMVRLLAEVYFEALMLSAMNLRTVDWDDQYSFTKYSNILSVISIVALIALLFLLLFVYFIKRDKWSEKKFKQRYGTLL